MGVATNLEQVDTVVVGNGPGGICVSLALSGWWPYYEGQHPDPALESRLKGGPSSLLERDLASLSAGLQGRGRIPAGVLFDALMHPEADTGRVRPGALKVRHDPKRAVPHLVLGVGPAGGSWQKMVPGMLSLSPGYWMELPGWSLFEWARSHRRWLDPGARVARTDVAAYYQDYVDHMGLAPHMRTGVKVTAAARDSSGWVVTAEPVGGGPVMQRHARHLVLATGMYDRPKWLKVPGEDLPFVTHRPPEDGAGGAGPLLVVGSGLSAADAVLAAWHAGRDVVHASIDDPEATPMAGLAPDVYPEYRELLEAMQGAPGGGYEPLLRSRLVEIRPDGTCRLETPGGEVTRRFSQVAVLVGSTPDLSFLPAASRGDGETLRVDPNTLRTETPGLYAIGPLAGDNFTRFIPGHAFAVARDLIADRRPAPDRR
jgi:Pyridine nucleotide-disulphide oxidoreductase